MFFNPFSTKDSFADNEHSPGAIFYHDVSMPYTQYLISDKFKTNFQEFLKNSISVFNLNI